MYSGLKCLSCAEISSAPYFAFPLSLGWEVFEVWLGLVGMGMGMGMEVLVNGREEAFMRCTQMSWLDFRQRVQLFGGFEGGLVLDLKEQRRERRVHWRQDSLMKEVLGLSWGSGLGVGDWEGGGFVKEVISVSLGFG